MAEKVAFTRASAQKIADGLRTVERLQSQQPSGRRQGSAGDHGYRILTCKTTEAATSGMFATCEIWDGPTVDAYTASGEEIEVYFRIGDADDDVFVYVLESIRGYEAIAKACP